MSIEELTGRNAIRNRKDNNNGNKEVVEPKGIKKQEMNQNDLYSSLSQSYHLITKNMRDKPLFDYEKQL